MNLHTHTHLWKVLMLASFLSFAFSSNGQKSLELTGTPEDSFGYLIWKNNDANIAYNRFEIQQTIVSSTDTISRVISQGEIWRQNHLFVPMEYYSNQESDTSYQVKLYAVGSDHVDNPDHIEFAQIGGTGEKDCFWECVSSTYAFRIQQYNTPNAMHNYRLESTTPFGSLAPPYYYEWMDPAFYVGTFRGNLFDAGNSEWRDYYGIDAENEYNAMQADQIIKLDNTGSYFTSNGVEIHGPQFLYGIKKHIGPYAEYDPIEDLEYGPTTADHCDFYEVNSDGLGGMIDVMNNELYDLGRINTIIQCLANQADFDYTDNNGGNGDPWTNLYVELINKYNKWLFDTSPSDAGIVLEEGVFDEFVSDFYSFSLGDYDDPTTRFAEIALNSSMFRLTKISNDSTELIVSGSGFAFVDAQGYPNIPTINFTPGFYKLSLYTAGVGLNNTYFEVETNFVAGLSHKDFFSATIYPNPNIEEFYFADIQTTAKLKGRYEVFDGQGNLHYSYIFNLPKDHSGTHRISPDVILPIGMLYHKFSFLDGSYETITTLNQ